MIMGTTASRNSKILDFVRISAESEEIYGYCSILTLWKMGRSGDRDRLSQFSSRRSRFGSLIKAHCQGSTNWVRSWEFSMAFVWPSCRHNDQTVLWHTVRDFQRTVSYRLLTFWDYSHYCGLAGILSSFCFVAASIFWIKLDVFGCFILSNPNCRLILIQTIIQLICFTAHNISMFPFEMVHSVVRDAVLPLSK